MVELNEMLLHQRKQLYIYIQGIDTKKISCGNCGEKNKLD